MPTLFIGLGLRGEVTEQLLQQKLDAICSTTLRFRGSLAFCDVATEEDATTVIKTLNGTFMKNTKLSVKPHADKEVADMTRDGDARRARIREQGSKNESVITDNRRKYRQRPS